MDDQDLAKEISQLNKNLLRLNRHHGPANSFIRGIFSGLGSVIGATLVVALIAYLLSNVELIPLIGTWLAEIIDYVSQITSQN